jgi:hypothetical protein
MRLRRRLPGELQGAFDAFVDVVAHVELAKRALTRSVPSTRFAGEPLAETLMEYEEELAAAASTMTSWRRPEVEEAWRAAEAGIATALTLAERLRTEAPEPGGFEELIGLIGQLLTPLDAFADARDAFMRLRA